MNEKLAEIFVQLHISEKSGRGVPRIVETYGKDVFDITSNTINVKIPYDRVILGGTNQDTIQDTIQDTVQDTIQEGVGRIEMILSYCESPRSRRQIQEHIGIRNRSYFKNEILDPLVEQGRLAMTIPDKPTSKNQKYITVKH